jgi:hypothetical protein
MHCMPQQRRRQPPHTPVFLGSLTSTFTAACTATSSDGERRRDRLPFCAMIPARYQESPQSAKYAGQEYGWVGAVQKRGSGRVLGISFTTRQGFAAKQSHACFSNLEHSHFVGLHTRSEETLTLPQRLVQMSIFRRESHLHSLQIGQLPSTFDPHIHTHTHTHSYALHQSLENL